MFATRHLVQALALFIGAGCLFCSPITARAQLSADKLVEEFYAVYPCSDPAGAYRIARQHPWLPRAILASSRPERDRFAAYSSLVGSKARGYKQTIQLALTDRSNLIRSTAIHHLPLAFSGEDLVAKYIQLLDDPYLGVRYNCAEALARHPSSLAREALFKLLSDPSIETRHLAVGTLISWNDEEVVTRLRELTRSEDATVAGAAASALARHPEETIDVKVLHSYLQQELKTLKGPPYAGVGAVVHVIRLIAQRGDEKSLSVLSVAADHSHPHVREAALKASAELEAREGLGK